MKINSEQAMVSLGEEIGKKFVSLSGHFTIELVGDVGAGKTTFVKGLARGFGVREVITSPSFTISKTYVSETGKTLAHYDFYRLKDPGIMREDFEENIKNGDLVVVEWANSVADILPDEHFKIVIEYDDGDTREITFSENLDNLLKEKYETLS